LDLGNGALGPLQRHAPLDGINALVISHLHPDHCLDLCSFYVARHYLPGGPLGRIPVYGPAGTADRMARAYDLDPDPGMHPDFVFVDLDPGPFMLGPFTLRSVRVNHPVEAYAVRVEHGGRSLVYSGDTGPCAALVELARGADLLLCEASFHDGRDSAPDLHLNGREAAEHATLAGARRLLLTHLPPWNDPARSLAEAVPAFAGPVEVARAGAVLNI
jgi:ribonuclease BN (tRNA processing enzyme)